jgi:hypothetical protein
MIPRKMKNECQMVKVTLAEIWLDWLIHSKRAILAFFTPSVSAAA